MTLTENHFYNYIPIELLVIFLEIHNFTPKITKH